VAAPGVAGGVVARPALFERLGGPARVVVVSAPAGSGKTVLLRSWIAEAQLAGRAAWVAAGREGRGSQRFWLSVLGALRQTGPGAGLVRAVSAAPDLDGWALVEGLLHDLAPLADPVWLVMDDVHELGPDTLRQLELLVMRAPPGLRFVLSARHDVRLGLHRLRLDGGLAEIRAGDLEFTRAEAGELFIAAGVDLDEPALAVLHERTEGWAAGLRLAALSLAGHPDPGGFAAEFSGSERTVAEYLLAEVLDRQSESVRRLLLRTSILDRVNGELAELLTGDDGGERVLQDLEQAGAFVVSLDPARSWFRYHQMFAGLLQLELRRAAPGEVTRLHTAAAGWLAAHGFAVEAVRHAQAAQDWQLGARLLAGQWPALHLDGHAATVHELLAGFPAEARAADAELAVVAAADELAHGSLEAAERYLALARRHSESVPAGRREYARLLLGAVRLLLDRQRGNLPAVAADARELQAMAEVADAATPGLGADLSALALISLGSTEIYATAAEDAEGYLERGIALARQGRRPYLEFTGLAYQATHEFYHSFARAAERGRQAVELAERHGWTDDPAIGVACMAVGVVLVWQGQPDEAEPWVRRAERTFTPETQPLAVLATRVIRGTLELVRDRNAAALAALEAGEPLAQRLAGQHYLVARIRALLVHSLVGAGQFERAEQFLAGLGEQDRQRRELRVAAATLRLAQGDPQAALAALAPIRGHPVSISEDHWGFWRARADVLEAIARDALGDPDAADAAVERALDLSERSGDLTPFLLYPVSGLLERHARHRTGHAALVAEIRGLLAGTRAGPRHGAPPPSRPAPPLLEPLSGSELRVLRYLPTNLSMPEIARELSVSPNTVKTHVRHLYAKFGTHHRTEAVDLARSLGMLAASRTDPASRWTGLAGATGGGREQAQVAGPGDRLGPVVGAELGVEVAHVGLDGVDRDVQLAGDFRPGQVGRQVAQHAQLAVAQRFHRQPGPRGPRRRRQIALRRGTVAGERAENLGDQGDVGGAAPGLAFQQARHGMQQERQQPAARLG
jgi:LuxR family transcriptional regulator, maltose regulon positive regulatory protein